MLAIAALIAAIIALIVGSHDLHLPTFWFILAIAFLAAHEVVKWAYTLRGGRGRLLP